MMRVLVTGAGGLMGRALLGTAPSGVHLSGFTHDDLDITNADAVRSTVETVRPSLIINAAGYTDVDAAEQDAARAFAVNAAGPRHLGAVAQGMGIAVVHFSTDYVFDGERELPYPEEASPRPLGIYGESKLEGERALQGSGARHFIIRTQWLYGGEQGFPATMASRARAGRPTRVVNDQFGAPTRALDVARLAWALHEQEGLLHVASAGRTSWYGVAERIFAHFGVAGLLTSCSSAEHGAVAPRPRNAALDTRRLHALGIDLPSWQDTLDEWLRAGMEPPRAPA